MMKALTKKRGFPFRNAVALLDAAETVERRARERKSNSKNQKTAIEKERKEQLEETIEAWFTHNKDLLDERLESPVALFSILFPKDRTDRCYNYQPPKLYKALAKWLGISPGRTACLEPGSWTLRFDDFGAALEDVMRVAENPETEVTCEEVDAVLDVVAGKSIFSSKRVRGRGAEVSVDEALGGLLRRLSSLEAKWLMRVVLKETRVVQLPVSFTLGQYHFLLPHIYTIQHDLTFAFKALDDELLSCLPAHPPPEKFGKYLLSATRQIKPIVGIQIQLPEFWKARSVKHAAKRVMGKQVYMERKYDGEYCQVHIDLKKPWKERITIFSKSGRDSTEDRKGLHKAIEQGLRLNNVGKKIESCILEGEMFVYDEVGKCCMDFSEIRKHVTRAGRMLGTDYDEKPDYTTQHLMVVFFDVLYHDGVSYLDRPLHERKSLLEKLVTPIEGLCELPYNKLLNLAGHGEEYCINYINAEFKKGIAKRFEGYILKPYDAPYIGFGLTGNPHHWVKLKKDYIPGLGDTLDACIIGATHEPARGLEMNVDPSVMTSYFIGFVKDKETVLRTGERRTFVVVDVIAHCLPPHIQKLWNDRFRAFGITYQKGETNEGVNFGLEIREGIPRIQKLLPEPIVAEIIGGSFHKPSNFCHYILRWPRLVRFKSELSWTDAMDFEGLQEAAYQALSTPEGHQMAEEERAWEIRLEQSLMTKKRKIAEAVLDPPPFPKRDSSTDANIARLRMEANRSVVNAGWRFWDQTGDLGPQSQDSCRSTQDRDMEDSPRMAYLELVAGRDEKLNGEASIATNTLSQFVDIAIRESQREEVRESVNGGGNSTATFTIAEPSENEDKDTLELVGTSDRLPPISRPNGIDSERVEQLSAINSHPQAPSPNNLKSERAVKTTPLSTRKQEPYPTPLSHKPPPTRKDDDDLQILSYRKLRTSKPLPTPPRLLKGLSTPRSIRSIISRRPTAPKSPPLIIDLSTDDPYPTPPNTSPPIPTPTPFHHAQILLGTHLSQIPHLASLLLPHTPHSITPLSAFLSTPHFDAAASNTILLIDQRMVDPMRGDIRAVKKLVEEENLASGGLGGVRVGVYCWRGLEGDEGGRRGWGEWERGWIP